VAHSATFQLNSTLDTTRNNSGAIAYRTTAGKNIVFKFENEKGVHTNDGQSGTILEFQVDGGATSFSYTDEQLTQRLTNYLTWYSGWESGEQFYAITKGTISGELQPNGFWKVTIDVTLPVIDDFTFTNSIKTTGYFMPVQTL
jgi:hypothetical protein